MQWEITGSLLDIPSALLKRRSLRSLDALQLATALHLKGYLLPGDQLFFIASDQRLLQAASAEGLMVWNPETTPAPGDNLL